MTAEPELPPEAPKGDTGQNLAQSYDVVRDPERLDDRDIISSLGPVSLETLRILAQSDAFRTLQRYFSNYPPHSLMSDRCRALLYSLIRMTKPRAVVEIGTLHAGTSEVLCRALWESEQGTLFTTDPYGAERCPAAIARWPVPLRRVEFRPDCSMAFFQHLRERGIIPDLVLIDGNHEFEHAFFDLQLAAKTIRPGGLVIMDNAEQTGPFQAARQFLGLNPAWTEIGAAIASFDEDRPFGAPNSSFPDTTFVLLQSPTCFVLNPAMPASWGQIFVDEQQIDGFRIEFVPQTAEGVLHYRVYFRAFAQGQKFVTEDVRVGQVPIKLSGRDLLLMHRIEPIVPDLPTRFPEDCRQTVEIELFWLPVRERSSCLMFQELPCAFSSRESLSGTQGVGKTC